MGSVRASGRMMKKSTVRDMNGQIINMIDEENGGWIIRNRQIVNQQRWEELLAIEADKREAAKAAAIGMAEAQAKEAAQPSKVDELEKRMDAQDAKLDAILAALKK